MSTVKISGMSCQHCVASVSKALKGINGISDVAVDLAKKEATFTAAPDLDAEMVKNAIIKIGFSVDGMNI